MDAKKHPKERYRSAVRRERWLARSAGSLPDGSEPGRERCVHCAINRFSGWKFTTANTGPSATAANRFTAILIMSTSKPSMTTEFARPSSTGFCNDKLNLSAVQASMQRDFLVKLSSGYIYAALDHAIRKFDGNEFRKYVLSQFSGVLCIDEIHLGHRVLLLASDPIADNPVACALVSKNDAAHMIRFMRNLDNHGFSPHTVVSDRSHLYPLALEKVWPDAEHQLCVFHVIAELNKLVLDAARTVRRELKPKSIKKGRGRPSRKQQARARKLKAQRVQADKLFRNRHTLVTKAVEDDQQTNETA